MKLLKIIEKTDNKLPDPATLFLPGGALVFVLSLIVVEVGWAVTGSGFQRGEGVG